MTASTTPPSPAAPVAGPERPAGTPTLGHVLLVALVVGSFAVVWLTTYSRLNDLIWTNPFVVSNRWMIPVGTVFFSLLVGLVQKYLHAQNVISGGAAEVLQSEGGLSYATFWGTLLSSFFSLWSGASVGPEGPLGFLAIDVSAWLAEKLKLVKQTWVGVALAGMSAAYNGIVGNPVFATVFATEASSAKYDFFVLAANLLAGAVGFLLFALLHVPAFAGFLNVGEPAGLELIWVGWAIALGVVGAVIAAYIGLAFRVLGTGMDRFKDRVVLRALVGGAVIGIVCYLIPDLMFSGESSIHPIMANPAEVGVGMLLLLALLKPLLLALSFKSGFLGGPTFPAMFTAVMVGLAISLVAPGVPLSILIACTVVAVVTLVLKAPLTSILLVSVVTQAGADLLGLITVAAVTAMVMGQAVQAMMARRAQDRPVVGRT